MFGVANGDVAGPEHTMELDGLRPAAHYVTHLACIRGCMRYLGCDVGDAWLFGGTGYAFMMNIPREVHCMGPTCWDLHSLSDRTSNLGVRTDRYVAAQITDPDFVLKQREARQFVCSSLSQGIPCYGCELGYPEFYTIHACDGEGIRYRCCWEPDECSRSWCELGTEDAGCVCVGAVEKCDAADDEVCVRDALEFAVRLNDEPPSNIGAKSTGLAAYDAWIEEMDSGRWRCDFPYGLPHNAAHWTECRSFAAPFLDEAGRRLKDRDLFTPAAHHYQSVYEAMKPLPIMFQSNTPYESIRTEDVRVAIERLMLARDAEAAGIDELRRILVKLG